MKLRNILNDLYEGFLISWKAGKRYAVYNFVLCLITVLLPLISLWFIKQIIDIVTKYSQATHQDFIYAILSLVVVQLLYAVVQQLLNDIQTVQQQLVIDHLTKKVLEKAISVEYAYYEKAAYFNSLHIAQQEVMYRAGILTSGFNQVLQSGLSMMIIAAIFIQFNWLYGVLVLVASLPVLAVKWKHIKATQQLEMQNLLNERKANYLSRMLTDSVHAKEVRTFFFGNFFIEKFTDIRRKIFIEKKKLSAKQAWAEILIQSIEILILAAIIYNLGISTLDGVITAGSFIFYLQALQRIQSAFKNFIHSFTLVFRQRFFLNNIFSFLNIAPAKKENSYSIIFPEKISKGIALKEVFFSYPGSDIQALQQVNMQFKPGKVTAIIGENGSGKSTLVKLLLRLHKPSSGSITLDDHNIYDITAETYSNKVSTIFQDYNQYHFSLEQNILLGHSKKEENIAAAEYNADITSLKNNLPNGYQTVLGKMFGNDLQLSGGQWQKIAIARMLYRNAAVMILDEPTSNIDPIAEYEILKRIVANKQNKIIILITHRLHNLKFADYVYVMEDGKLNGEGSVEQLLASNNLFKQMHQRQELYKNTYSHI